MQKVVVFSPPDRKTTLEIIRGASRAGAGRIGNYPLHRTPVTRAGVSDHVWSVEEIVGLLDFAETRSN